MDTEALIAELDKLIAKKEGVLKVVAQLTKQVWQIDWTVAVFDIVSHYLEFDIPYFYRFMQMDEGDEEEEKQILQDWIATRDSLNKETKVKIKGLVEELNQLRIAARQS